MATSTLKLYKTKITPERNAMIDDIETYLLYCTKETINNFQYQKIALDMVIKVNHTQATPVTTKYNYCSITQDSKIYYYFILSYRQLSENCIEYTLSIDSLNTWKDNFSWSNKTNIVRQHEDRFINTDKFVPNSTFTLHRKINPVSEGFGEVTKFKTGDMPIEEFITEDEVSTNFYLVYRTPIEASKALEVALLAKDNVKIGAGNYTPIQIDAGDLIDGYWYYFSYVNQPTGTYRINGGSATSIGTYIIAMRKSGPNIEYVKFHDGDTTWSYLTCDDITFVANTHFLAYTTNALTTSLWNIQNIPEGQRMQIETGTSTVFLKKISALDRTDSKLLKIVELPYLPDGFEWTGNVLTTIPSGWSLTLQNELVLSDYSKEFERTIPYIDLSDVLNVSVNTSYTEDQFKALTANSKYESKLYHSDLFVDKLQYDSFSSNIQLEKLSLDKNNRKIDLKFKPSNTLSSNLIFKWYPNNGIYNETGDYDYYLVSNRNNEMPVFTSDYLNYIRTGYNYDREKANSTNAVNWISTIGSIAGSVVSAVTAIKTGGLSIAVAASMGISAFTSITNSWNNSVQSDKQLSQKLYELSNQSANVNGINDIDLFNYYGWQKLRRVQYSLSDNSKNIAYELFRKCGYAKNEFGVPNYTSRLRYNYIQCEAIFNNEESNPIFNNFLDDIKARFASGVTVYHNVNQTWDFEQQYENWEIALFV